MKDTRTYKKLKDGSIHADVYYQGSQSPVIIYLHSGGLIFGSRNGLPKEQIAFYRNAGFSVVNIDYRLAPETKLHHIIEDVRDAFLWVKTEASQFYDFDTENISLIGSSAGGYLSLLLGTIEIKPRSIISFYGYGDILGDWCSLPSEFYCQRPMITQKDAYRSVSHFEISDGPLERFIYYLYCRQTGQWVYEVTGLHAAVDYDKLIPFNPINNITSEFPPTLFLHGDKDTDVPYEQSVMMYNKLLDLGVRTDLITIKDGDHVFDKYFNTPTVRDAFDKVITFLKSNLK